MNETMSGRPTALLRCPRALAACSPGWLRDSFIYSGGDQGVLSPAAPGRVCAPGKSFLWEGRPGDPRLERVR